MKAAVFEVCLPTVNDVKNFVDITTRIQCEVDVLSGRYVVDGKSIMALFSVDLSRPIKVVILDGEAEAETFAELARNQFTTSRLK